MTSFALYRLPRQNQLTLIRQTDGNPPEFLSCAELNGREGFVVAPFAANEHQPILLIRPDQVQTADSLDDLTDWQPDWTQLLLSPSQVVTMPSCRADYAIDFANYHAQIEVGTFRKLVLARCCMEPRANDVSPLALFNRACTMYPRLFISLVYTPRSGLWLTATPEVLLEGDGAHWRTIALAGTMRLDDSDRDGEGENVRWAAKEIQEQRYVATYITECLEQFTGDFCEEGPRTVRAANLVHLRSDFTFTLFNNARAGDLLQALHPTPAVCGLPKREALRFILGNEHTPRQYYSGFMGPLSMDGHTHIFVSLRCMQMTSQHYLLYAGGGLLKDSVEEQEWQETEAKLETMRRCIATRKTSIS
jgi:isochorismate synthase